MTQEPREVLFEFKQFGRSVKVSAVDTASGAEVSIVGPATAGQEHLKRVALNKLRYVLAKKSGQ